MMKGMGAAGLAAHNSQIAWRPGRPRELAAAVPLRFRTPALQGLCTYSVVVAGSISPTGTVVKTTNKILGGSTGPSGNVVKTVTKLLDGALQPVGTLVKSTMKLLQGGLDFVGTLVKSTTKLVGGSVSPSGAVVKQSTKAVGSAVLAPTGDLALTDVPPVGGGSSTGGILTVVAEISDETKLT